MKKLENPSSYLLVGVGTTFDVSGHTAKVVAIKRDGVQVTIPNVAAPMMMVDFDQIELAIFGKK
jgi:hypothetical protein